MTLRPSADFRLMQLPKFSLNTLIRRSRNRAVIALLPDHPQDEVMTAARSAPSS
ncbi:hypothetical protein LAZ40_06355 [Cereibacter sphaeroides]|uniref:hypothetical protein n=1 Tax=Cereibacter sphaeroides TaxID=1063 RepID=UPI001F357905|nr:hypothetical protein [Cereibacter sphaeroides]MCE6950245.1 hypothetical protein [Cereibacter sphaeroides]MCE6958669.1 hypothetical protein [Cereibacter sphaeroides]MCE6973448.1 hypothetical protein [Cereibacter sphaeroides]